MVECTSKNERIDELLRRAKSSSNKGRMYVYESYKQELIEMNPTPEVYEQTCRKLAQYLRV